jgi:hypothetical protein
MSTMNQTSPIPIIKSRAFEVAFQHSYESVSEIVERVLAKHPLRKMGKTKRDRQSKTA